MRPALLALALILPTPIQALDRAEVIRDVVQNHIVPGYEAFDLASDRLDAAAQADCEATSRALRTAYNDAFDAWIRVSHLRFGPSETDDRAFALAFWPDPRGDTPSALQDIITAEDPAVASQDSFAEISIAARGFYPLEFLLFDEAFATLGTEQYRCALIQAVTRDIASSAATIHEDWLNGYADQLLSPGGNDAYRSEADVIQEFYDALGAGLEFTADSRLGRPMGTFDDPKPLRAEARRSGRSLVHVQLSLAALRDLSDRLARGEPVAVRLDEAFARAQQMAENLGDPVFAGVADPQGRLRVETLKGAVDRISRLVDQELGPALGVVAGFNAADGD